MLKFLCWFYRSRFKSKIYRDKKSMVNLSPQDKSIVVSEGNTNFNLPAYAVIFTMIA